MSTDALSMDRPVARGPHALPGSPPEAPHEPHQPDRLQENLGSRGVVVEAHHQCMSLRGVRAPRSATVTSALHGHLRDDAAAGAEFLGPATA